MANEIDLQKQVFITGEDFTQMIRLGIDNLTTHLDEVNDLNVFPVPDGDTGTNMRRTIATGYDAIKDYENEPISTVAQHLSKGMLLGARGNSGVILSQIFRGFSTGVGNAKRLDVLGLSVAFKSAVDRAYSAVIKPVEGTILTVIRESVLKANSQLLGKNPFKYFCDLVDQARITLSKTTEMLDALKEANVVDSGGAGLLYIFEGFKSYFEGGVVKNEDSHALNEDHEDKNTQELDFSLFNENSELDYGYCTEFILQLSAKKVEDCENFDVNEIVSYLTSVGESVVCFKDGTVVKTHVHTKDPGSILSYVRKWGEFLTVKVENMALQHNNKIHKEEEKKSKIHKPVASVAVSQGDGLTQAFKQLGVDEIVSGQQTMNPSTEDFIKAFNNIDADTIIVFPNNSNIILAAEQARDMYMSEHENIRVEVIKSKSVCQGYIACSLLQFPYEKADELISDINDSINSVSSIEVTTAIRDTTVSGVNVKNGHSIGILDHNLVSDNENQLECLIESIKKVDGISSRESILIIFGKDGLKSKTEVLNRIKKEFPSVQVQTIDGGQDIYPFFVAVL